MRHDVTRSFLWRRRLHRLLDVVFPNDEAHCAICSRPLYSLTPSTFQLQHPAHDGEEMATLPLCIRCLQEMEQCDFHPTRFNVALSHRRQLEVGACIIYDRFVRTLFRSFKYDGLIHLATFFTDTLASGFYAGGLNDRDIQYIVPVPSTSDRTAKRGYDHVHLLTDSLSRITGLPVKPALFRANAEDGFTQSQTARGYQARKQSMERAYDINRQIPIRGSKVLLVDDIVTTGATLTSCAKRLYLAGASEVIALVIARVE